MQVNIQAGIPEQGQVVTVRQRRYVVTEVQKSTLPPDPLAIQWDGVQHLISMNCIEDDGLGESLQVIWELEPGAQIDERVGLPQPTGFDSPKRLDAFLNAVRWGAVSSADMRALQAPFRSGIDVEDYQLDPLVRAIQMPRANLLIADDVGLGKTIEAGLVVQELIVRNRARTVMIVCPAGLQIHWRDQMRDKFGLEFRIVDSNLMKELRRSRGIHANPWTHFPRLITSIDFIKRDRPMRLFREVLPTETAYPRRFDILIVDEAHNVAPAGGGKFAIDSQRTQTIRDIAPHFEHKMFLTATPHNGYIESFSALLELLDNQRFARSVYPDRRQLETVMVRRLKTELLKWNGQPRFPRRILDVIDVAYTDEEKQVHRWLKEYSELRQKGIQSSEEHYATEFVLKLLKKRLFSSPAAFALTLAKHIQTLQGKGEKDNKKEQHAERMKIGILRQQIARMNEDYADDNEYEDAGVEAAETASGLFHDLSPRERELLDQMNAWAQQAAYATDRKTQAFIDWLRGIVMKDGKWTDERVIIFTEYRATQNALHTLLSAEGLTQGERVQTLFGGMDPEQREMVKAAFQASPELSPVRILLATDAASEGIDLQNFCHRLVHFEIPWNPNRMEQRNGRIDRHGQKENPLIYHFVSKGYEKQIEARALEIGELDADLEFLMHAALKVDQIREDLGSVGPVIAQQVEEAMLGRRGQLDTQVVEDGAQAARKMVKFERDLRKLIEQHYDQLQESRQALNLTPENVQEVVNVALELDGQLSLIRASADHPLHGKAFYLPTLKGSWSSAVEGLQHPHTHEVRPIIFDPTLASGRDDVVLAHLNHRLVQMALRLLRAEVWSPNGRKGLFRVTVRPVPNQALDTPAVIAHARLVVVGGDSQRLHEEIITAGGVIRKGHFRRFNVGQTETVLQAAQDGPVSAEVQRELQAIWPTIEPALLAALEARMQDRLYGMQKLLEERQQKELADIAAILAELQQAIEKELGDPQYQQLTLWSTAEREQITRNVQALRLRLDQIPLELEQEKASISSRYANPQSRLFPVAITFFVPHKMGGF